MAVRRRPVGVLVVALVVSCAAALAPQGAGAITVGTNLDRYTPNVNFDCSTRPSVIGPLPSGGPDTCTYLSTLIGAQSTASPFLGGVVTRVSVKAAAPVGPMQVTITRAIGTTTSGIGCCFYAGESQPFTPRANATTSVPVRLPVESTIDPVAGVQTVDYLGLTVLQAGVAIPGQYPGNSSLEGSLGFFPRLSSQDSVSGRVDGYGNSLVPLLSAEVIPLCGAAGASTPRSMRAALRGEGLPAPAKANASAGRCFGGVTPRPGSLSGSAARVPLDCNLTAGCRGRLILTGSGKIGSARFDLAAGAREKVRVKLNRKGRKLAKGRRSLKVKVKAKVKAGPNESRRIKLKR